MPVTGSGRFNESEEERAERLRLEREAFERLPEDVKQATLARQREVEEYRAAAVQRFKNREIVGGVAGGAIAAFMGYVVEVLVGNSSWVFMALLLAAGAGAGYCIVRFKLHTTTGMCVYGVPAIAVMLIGLATGMLVVPGRGFHYLFVFSSWLFYIGAGFAIAQWAATERSRTDTF